MLLLSHVEFVAGREPEFSDDAAAKYLAGHAEEDPWEETRRCSGVDAKKCAEWIRRRDRKEKRSSGESSEDKRDPHKRKSAESKNKSDREKEKPGEESDKNNTERKRRRQRPAAVGGETPITPLASPLEIMIELLGEVIGALKSIIVHLLGQSPTG
jgi:hypothetical protein